MTTSSQPDGSTASAVQLAEPFSPCLLVFIALQFFADSNELMNTNTFTQQSAAGENAVATLRAVDVDLEDTNRTEHGHGRTPARLASSPRDDRHHKVKQVQCDDAYANLLTEKDTSAGCLRPASVGTGASMTEQRPHCQCS